MRICVYSFKDGQLRQEVIDMHMQITTQGNWQLVKSECYIASKFRMRIMQLYGI